MDQRLLVSGFEPFGANAVNPSGDAVRALAGVRTTVVLPVTYAGAWQVLGARLHREDATASLMFGLGHAGPLRLERCAYNALDGAVADNAGVVAEPGARLDPCDEPGAVRRTEIAVDRLHAALLEAGVPVECSDDPGRFVCNATYYRALGSPWGPRALFVHVPPTRELGGNVDAGDVTRWVRQVVEGFEKLMAGA